MSGERSLAGKVRRDRLGRRTDACNPLTESMSGDPAYERARLLLDLGETMIRLCAGYEQGTTIACGGCGMSHGEASEVPELHARIARLEAKLAGECPTCHGLPPMDLGDTYPSPNELTCPTCGSCGIEGDRRLLRCSAARLRASRNVSLNSIPGDEDPPELSAIARVIEHGESVEAELQRLEVEWRDLAMRNHAAGELEAGYRRDSAARIARLEAELAEVKQQKARIEHLFALGHNPEACLAGDPGDDCELCGRKGTT